MDSLSTKWVKSFPLFLIAVFSKQKIRVKLLEEGGLGIRY